jgi:hypothetical protein
VIAVSLVAALFFATLVVWAVALSIVYDGLCRRIEEQRRAIAELRCRVLEVESARIVRIGRAEDAASGSSHSGRT